ncbi:MAG: serine hydrolase [Clostridia bacterium]|nr:serine hydrolase [Clostridia bacterium]
MSAKPFVFWSSPEEAGVSSAGLLRFLDAWERERGTVQFHSMILLRHGKIVCRMNFAPYDDVTPHTMFSLSKSFTSAAAGFAVSEGKLRWDSSVVDVLPEEIPEGRAEELRCVTLEALLCMGSGLDPASDSPSRTPGVTWARHVLSHKPVHPPMTHFHYNSFGTYLVSCMVQKAVGENIRDYLIPRLFQPLGIGVPEWDMSPEGVCCGGFGLHLKAEDIARFGQCLLQKGVRDGRQVLPEGWVELATREHIANYAGEREEGNEWGQGYGFQFWRCIDGRYRGDGAMGQACIVDEARDAVLAVTCGTGDMGTEFRLIREHIFPAFDAPAGTQAEQTALRERIGALAYAFPADDGSDRPLPEGVFEMPFQGRTLRLSLRMFEALDQLEIRMRFSESEEILFSLPRGKAGLCAAVPNGRVFLRYFGCFGWEKGTLRVCLRSPDGPDTMDGVLSWTRDSLHFDGTGVDFPSGSLTFTRVPAQA